MPDQRDIVLVPIPFTDLKSSKKRPVIVLSKTAYNREFQDVLVAAITSHVQPNRKFSQEITSHDLEEGHLPLTSQIRIDKIYCLHQRLILRKYGTLKKESFDNLVKMLIDLVKSDSKDHAQG